MHFQNGNLDLNQKQSDVTNDTNIVYDLFDDIINGTILLQIVNFVLRENRSVN